MPAAAAAPRLKPAAHYHFLAETLRTLEGAVRHGFEGGHFIPEDWAALALEEPVPAKEKLTLRVDADVLRFFRLMGQGYLTQMNRVLRAFMHARLSGVVKGPEEVDHGPTPGERYVMQAHALTVAMARTNLRMAAGMDCRAEELEQQRALLALDRLADEIGLPQEDRLRSAPPESRPPLRGRPGAT